LTAAAVLWGLGALAAAFLALLWVPRFFVGRAQDRLAARVLSGGEERFKLLTRAELVVGPHRRLPGVLALTEGAIEFQGLFGESVPIATDRIQKIETGSRLSTGRRLFRLEVLRLTRLSGAREEFVLSPASAGAWRSHLGLWAMRERQADADRVVPGR
jgi:hypothetical protein